MAALRKRAITRQVPAPERLPNVRQIVRRAGRLVEGDPICRRHGCSNDRGRHISAKPHMKRVSGIDDVPPQPRITALHTIVVHVRWSDDKVCGAADKLHPPPSNFGEETTMLKIRMNRAEAVMRNWCRELRVSG